MHFQLLLKLLLLASRNLCAFSNTKIYAILRQGSSKRQTDHEHYHTINALSQDICNTLVSAI